MTEEDIAEIRISLFHFWLLVDGFLLLEHFCLSADFWKMVFSAPVERESASFL